MGYIFDQKTAERQEAWFKTESGQAAFRLQSDLVMRLLKPMPRERILDVGCGSGLYLQKFKQAGLLVTGLDPSKVMLNLAAERLGSRTGLFPGEAEDLPFEDNEFDLVTMITSLEFTGDPAAALAEAMRVARRRVFIGVLNKCSLTAMVRRARGLVRSSVYNQARFFSLWELLGMLGHLTDTSRARWGTVQILPLNLTHYFIKLESWPTLQANPFGAFLGVAADKTYSLRTENLAVKAKIALKPRPAPTPSTSFGPKLTGFTAPLNHSASPGRELFPSY